MKKNKKKQPVGQPDVHITAQEKTMGSFWIKFIISEAISVVEAFVASSKLTPAQKALAEELLAAAQKFLAGL